MIISRPRNVRNLAALLLSTAWVASASPAGRAAGDDGPRLTELHRGVFAVLQPDAGRFNDSNSVVIFDDRGVVVVDSQGSETWTRGVIEAILDRTSQPVRYVINTHWHSDHTQGNWVYRQAFPDVQFLGHATLADDLEARAASQLQEAVERYVDGIAGAEARAHKRVDREGNDLDDTGLADLQRGIEAARVRLEELRRAHFPPPDLTFDEGLVLHRPGREIRLLHFRAHTRGDVVVHLPAERLLITGDLLDALPYGGHGYPSTWIESLDRLEKLEFDVIVPGHGGLFRSKEQLRLLRDLLTVIVTAAREAVAGDQPLGTLQERLDLARFREALAGDDPLANRTFDSFVPDLVERAFQEADGSIDDAS